MDAVTRYECRHKIKSGEACRDRRSYYDYMMNLDPANFDLVMRAVHPYDPEAADDMLRRWAIASGWVEGMAGPQAMQRRYRIEAAQGYARRQRRERVIRAIDCFLVVGILVVIASLLVATGNLLGWW